MKPFEEDYEEAHCEACERLRKTESGTVCQRHRSKKPVIITNELLRALHRKAAEAKARREEQAESGGNTEENRDCQTPTNVNYNRTKRY